MFRLSFILYLIVAPTLMGSLVLTVLVVPELSSDQASLITLSAIGGALLGIPASYLIAKKINNLIKPS